MCTNISIIRPVQTLQVLLEKEVEEKTVFQVVQVFQMSQVIEEGVVGEEEE